MTNQRTGLSLCYIVPLTHLADFHAPETILSVLLYQNVKI